MPAPLTSPRSDPAREPSRSGASRREWAAIFAIAAACIVFRSLVFLLYEHAYFDSDQAIVGLMAKHLSEGRAFPLFFYGQNYMLGAEAWLTVPFFWIGGASVASLRAAIISINFVAAALLILGLVREGRVRPWLALAASMVFLLAPPRTAAFLVEAQGGNIEPFVYVLLLWYLRARPLWFGIVLGIGFLNREFTLYAVPVLLAGDAITGRLRSREGVRSWLLALVAFAGTWELVRSLERFADMYGPGTRGTLLRGFSGAQVGNLLERFNWAPAQIPARIQAFAADVFPALAGVRPLDDAVFRQGVDGLVWLAWPVALVVLLRVAWLARAAGSQSLRDTAFSWYLLGVGLVAATAYVVGRPVEFGTVRYVLLVLLAPVGALGLLYALERDRRWRAGAGIALAAWAALSLVASARLQMLYATEPPPNQVRELADALAARGVTVAQAPYWRAYRVTFLTGERLKIASSDVVRIEEYQRLAAQEGPRLLRIQEDPCPGGERVSIWYLCRAAQR